MIEELPSKRHRKLVPKDQLNFITTTSSGSEKSHAKVSSKKSGSRVPEKKMNEAIKTVVGSSSGSKKDGMSDMLKRLL